MRKFENYKIDSTVFGNYAIFILMIVLSFAACRPVKNVQTIQSVISKKDTIQRVMVVESDSKSKDSMEMIYRVVDDLKKRKIVFETFNARVKVNYESKGNETQANANIRIKRDSAIWISLTGPFNIEGYRLLITKDSVKLMNMLDKTIEYRSISYLQEITNVPFDFSTIQDIVIGNPLYISDNIVSYKNAENRIEVMFVNNLFKNLLTLDKHDKRLLYCKLDDVMPERNRTCDFTYTDYENRSDFNFSTLRKISVSEQSRLDITIEFKKYEFGSNLSFPFTVPKSFRRN